MNTYIGIPVIISPKCIRRKRPWWQWLWYWSRWEWIDILEDGKVLHMLGKVYMNATTFKALKEGSKIKDDA
jgi:hypothetical protein